MGGRTWASPLTSQHGLLLLGSADEAADALDHLTLGLHLLVFALFRQEHDWREATETHNMSDIISQPQSVRTTAEDETTFGLLVHQTVSDRV